MQMSSQLTIGLSGMIIGQTVEPTVDPCKHHMKVRSWWNLNKDVHFVQCNLVMFHLFESISVTIVIMRPDLLYAGVCLF